MESGDALGAPPAALVTPLVHRESVQIAGASLVLFTATFLVAQSRPVKGPVGRWFEAQRGEAMDTRSVDRTVRGLALRLATFLHNAIVIPLALWALSDPELWADEVGAVTRVSDAVLGVTTGFFIFDAGACLARLREEGFQFLMHGSLCAAFFTFTVLSRTFHFYGCAYLLWELSTGLVHVRWLLLQIGRSHTGLYLVNGLAMMATFFGCRILWGGYVSAKFFALSARYLADPSQSGVHLTLWGLRAICVGLNGLNLFWFSKMVEKVFQLFVLRKSSKEVFHEKGD